MSKTKLNTEEPEDDNIHSKSCEENYQNEMKTLPRRLYTAIPDRSGGRYVVDETREKSRASKSVLFEEIDLRTYRKNAKCIGFCTSADRLGFWISIFQTRYMDKINNSPNFRVCWEESDSSIDANKCDKILIHFYRVSTAGIESQLSTITIFVTTGRIQVQGNLCMDWFREEFPLMLALVNNTDHAAFTQEKYLGFSLNNSSTDIRDKEGVEPESKSTVTRGGSRLVQLVLWH